MTTKKDFKKAIFGYLGGLGQEYTATLTEAEDRRFWRAWGEVQDTLDRLSGGDGFDYSTALYDARTVYGQLTDGEPFATGIARNRSGYDSAELEKMGMKGVVKYD